MYRLIIVDDEFEIRNGLSRYFPWESVGFEAAAVFENARGALDYIRRNPVDVVLTDIEMPGISGMEIPQQVKGFLPNARIIFVTSHTEYAIDAFELSIFRYVPKNNLETKLTAAITDAAKLIELEAGQEYTIQTANHMEKIPYKDIFYIQRDGKNSSIVSSVGTSKVRITMNICSRDRELLVLTFNF